MKAVIANSDPQSMTLNDQARADCNMSRVFRAS